MENHCMSGGWRRRRPAGRWKWKSAALSLLVAAFVCCCYPDSAHASEVGLKIPDLNSARFLGGHIGGLTLLSWGLLICGLGLVFGLLMYRHLKHLPVHEAMREVS